MAERYKDAEAFFEAYKGLNPVHQGKAEKYVKNLARLEKAETSLGWEEKSLSREMKIKDVPEEKNVDGKIHCSFCGKSEDYVRRLIVGPDGKVYICDECAALCAEIMEEEFRNHDFEAEEKKDNSESAQPTEKPEESKKK